MFVEAIDKVTKFTRPLHSISRNYRSNDVHPGAATLFFVNKEGWALTCGHVARQIIAAVEINNNYKNFKKELKNREGEMKRNRLLKELEKKYGYTKKKPVELKNRFINCVEGKLKLDIKIHKEVDLTLLKFNDFDKILCDHFPMFPKDTTELKQGKYLCRLGFPFPEFTNYEYSEKNDEIDWSNSGKDSTPQFPIEGMLTRHLMDNKNSLFGFEMSTPGLRGQSGGPVFDKNGFVWSMQSATAHLDLNFDVNEEVVRDGVKNKVSDSAFLHVGHCIHINVIKLFMNENSVSFDEGE